MFVLRLVTRVFMRQGGNAGREDISAALHAYDRLSIEPDGDMTLTREASRPCPGRWVNISGLLKHNR